MAYGRQVGAIRANRALRVLLVSNSMVLISLGMLVPVYALFVQQIGGSALAAGLTAGALGLTSAVSALISGSLIDKLDHHKTRLILAGGWAGIGATTLLYLMVDSLGALFAVQIILGFVKTVSAPAFDTLYARHLDKAAAGKEYGIWEASFFLTAGISAVAGGVVVDRYGFDGVFIVMAVLAFAAAFYVWSLPRRLL